MTIDPETLMAYADGECDPLTAKRVERAISEDPALGEEIAAHRRLRATLAGAFAPIAAETPPVHLTALLERRVVPLPVLARPRFDLRWGGAIAASLVLGLLVGQAWRPGGPGEGPAAVEAAGRLDTALDRQLASADPAPYRVVASFRAREGAMCRIFTGAGSQGIACLGNDGDWAIRHLKPAADAAGSDYRQASSLDPALMGAAQAMMAGDPLDAAHERAARDSGWR